MDIHEIIERDENIKRLMAISKANELVTEMQHEVDKYTKLLQLAKEDQVYTVTHNVNYFQFLFRIKPAYDYFYAPKDTDKRSDECIKAIKWARIQMKTTHIVNITEDDEK